MQQDADEALMQLLSVMGTNMTQGFPDTCISLPERGGLENNGNNILTIRTLGGANPIEAIFNGEMKQITTCDETEEVT